MSFGFDIESHLEKKAETDQMIQLRKIELKEKCRLEESKTKKLKNHYVSFIGNHWNTDGLSLEQWQGGPQGNQILDIIHFLWLDTFRL